MDSNIFQRDLIIYDGAWQERGRLYENAWYYYNGTVFEERARNADNKPGAKKYPLRINQVSYSCNKHALHLWGQSDHAPIVNIHVKPKRSATGAAKERPDFIEKALYDFMDANEMATMLREAGRIYMIAGGAFFKLRRDLDNDVGVALEFLTPESVFPVWNPANYNQLLRVHIKFKIPMDIAATYGYKQGGDFGSGMVNYLETWTLDEWGAFIGFPGSWTPARDPASGEILAGENRCFDPVLGKRLMPIVYIPRLRTGKFYGQSLVDDIAALQNELNARLADQGDAVVVATHPGGWGRNIRMKNRAPIRVSGPEIIDIGDTVPGGADPHIEQFKAPDITAGVTTFTDKLEGILYDLASISPVMRGVDEGSQRSGLTLSVRALPTTSLVDDYRAFFRTGLRHIFKAYLGMCWGYREKGNLGLNEVAAAHFGHNIEVEFAPILPRDRTETADQVVKYRSAKVMSRRRAVELQPDVEDVELEIKELDAEDQQEQDAQMQLREQQAKLQAANRPPAAGKNSS